MLATTNRLLARAAGAVAVIVCVSGAAAWAQAPNQRAPFQQEPVAEEAPAEQPPAVPPSQSGLIGAIGRWVEESTNDVSSKFSGARQTIDDVNKDAARSGEKAVGAARGAAEGIIGLPASRIISGRSVCTITANGAPDCRAAAESLCKAKEFRRGTSLDTETAETCPPHIYLAGRPPKPGECKVETFVTRAVCQ